MAVVNLGHWLAVRLADFAGIASQAGIGQEAYYSGTVSFQAPFTSAFAAFRQPHDLPGMGKQVRGLAKYGEFTQQVCKKMQRRDAPLHESPMPAGDEYQAASVT